MMTSLEADALARKLGLRFDGIQDPVGAAAVTGSSEHIKLAFTCIAKGPAEGITIYAHPAASPEAITDIWNVKLAEVFAEEHRKLKVALTDCYMMARRAVWRLKREGFKEEFVSEFNHIIRFCEAAGCKPDILRGPQ